MRVLGDQHLELADQLGVAAEREVRLDRAPRAPRGAGPRAGRPRFGRTASAELGQAPARATARAPRADSRGGALGLRLARLGDQPLEALQVDLLRLDLEQVAGRPRHERLGRQQLAQPRDVDLHDRHRRLGRLVAPELVDQAVARDDRFAFTSSSASSARCFAPASGSGRSPSRTSSGPSTRYSIALRRLSSPRFSERPRGGKSFGETLDLKLDRSLGPIEVFQPVLSDLAQGDAGQLFVRRGRDAVSCETRTWPPWPAAPMRAAR